MIAEIFSERCPERKLTLHNLWYIYTFGFDFFRSLNSSKVEIDQIDQTANQNAEIRN